MSPNRRLGDYTPEKGSTNPTHGSKACARYTAIRLVANFPIRVSDTKPTVSRKGNIYRMNSVVPQGYDRIDPQRLTRREATAEDCRQYQNQRSGRKRNGIIGRYANKLGFQKSINGKSLLFLHTKFRDCRYRTLTTLGMHAPAIADSTGWVGADVRAQRR